MAVHLSLLKLRLVAGELSRSCGKRVQAHTARKVGHFPPIKTDVNYRVGCFLRYFTAGVRL